MLYWSAFILGLAGNVHCMGMCGPIALAIPVKRNSFGQKVISILLYNLGRVLVYAAVGGAFGLFGKGLFLAGFQQNFSIILGFIIIFGVLIPTVTQRLQIFNAPLFMGIGKLKARFGKHLSQRTYRSLFILGILNGLLPCGLVYMAVAGAMVASSWYGGMVYMALFGLGTLPVMMALPYFGQFISLKVRSRLKKLVPVTVFIFGLLLVLRGANLGIPYVSPELSNSGSCSQVKCH